MREKELYTAVVACDRGTLRDIEIWCRAGHAVRQTVRHVAAAEGWGKCTAINVRKKASYGKTSPQGDED